MSLNVNEQALNERIDPYLTPDRLSDICSKALNRPVTVRNVEVLSGGCLNRVVGLEFDKEMRALVLKASPSAYDRGLLHEFKVLEYFHRHTNMPVAEPVYFDDHADQLPGTFYLMEKLEGIIMQQARLFPSEVSAVISQIAEFVAELHGHSAEGFGGVELSPAERSGSWPDFWLKRFDSTMDRLRNAGVADASYFERIERIRTCFPELLNIGDRSTLTHYDIWSGNVILSLDHGHIKVSGFLDVQGYWADYARELSFMEMFGLANKAFFDIYKGHHKLDDQFQLRKHMYNLKMNLIHMEMYPGEYHYHQGALACIQFLEESIP